MATGIAVGFAGVSVIARAHGATVEVYDVGLRQPAGNTVDRRITAGTKDFTLGPAMTREQALTAIAIGADAATRAIDDGADVLVPGEVGLANTTPRRGPHRRPHRDGGRGGHRPGSRSR